MSLSKIIIYGDVAALESALAQVSGVDELDEYGFTPLIQTAIVNDVEKAALVLEAGADVEFTDISGRSALHWAVDNNNKALCELLLKYKADPNAYTRAGQPVLTYPFLRRQQALKQLLYEHGAVLDFARDFVNGKSLGHRFELEGRVDIVTPENMFIQLEFEGFYLESSLAMATNSLQNFKNNYGGKHLSPYFPLVQMVIDAMHNAQVLLRYQHYLTDVKKHQNEIGQALRNMPLVIPVCFSGHAITLIRFREWLVRCDRGEFGREHGTVILYKIGNPQALTSYLLSSLIYKRQDPHYINHEFVKILQLKPMMTLPLTDQTVGNCSWANVEAVLPATLYLLLMEQARRGSVVDIKACEETAMHVFDEWVSWDKNRELHFCIESFYSANAARKASKAALLAAILFQRLDYAREQDREKAERIMHILLIPEYRYILQSYLTVFWPDRQRVEMQNLKQFLDDADVDIERLYKDSDV